MKLNIGCVYMSLTVDECILFYFFCAHSFLYCTNGVVRNENASKNMPFLQGPQHFVIY